jgi:hypothetical protein
MSAKISLFLFGLSLVCSACLPPADPYPYAPPATVLAEAQALSDSLEAYIIRWANGQEPAQIPDHLIPEGISDSRNFYLKDPDSASAAETWATRLARPLNRDSLLTGIPDPKITYLFLGTALAPFGSKLVIEGEFPHCRFFSFQISPPLNGTEYYSQRQFGTAEVAIVDADIAPLPGHTNPFLPGADRNAVQRSYKVEFPLAIGDPVGLNGGAHNFPYRKSGNARTGALLVQQGPLGHKTVAGTPLPYPGDWNLGCIWVRYYEPDSAVGPLGGVPMPRVWFELPSGQRYFIGSDFSALQSRADTTSANRVTQPTYNANFGPNVGWYKSWSITRSMLNGVCQFNNWSRPDSGARVRDIDLGWTGRGENQPGAGKIEPHATTNNYASYLGRAASVGNGDVMVLTGKLPEFPRTFQGQSTMDGGQLRYWSICGIDTDFLSPLPATTIHAVSDEDLVLDANRNYVIAYSQSGSRPANATAANGVTWVDWGTQGDLGLLVRWVSVGPEWLFPLAPHEHNLDFAHSDWASTQYDSTRLGVNWRHGFMRCYLPRIHFMKKADFEAIASPLRADNIPVWVDSSYNKAGAADSQLGVLSASASLDGNPVNQPFNANDGQVNSAWSSAFGVPAATITLDLGQVRKLSAVKLHWDWIFFAKDYVVEVSSDGNTWTSIASATNENGAIDLYPRLAGISGRFVRLNLSAYNVGYYRLLEFEVYTMDCDCDALATSNTPRVVADTPLQLYPNPTHDNLHLLRPNSRPATLELYDLQGSLLLRRPSHQAHEEIDVQDLPAGGYLLRLHQDGQSVTRRWIKQ